MDTEELCLYVCESFYYPERTQCLWLATPEQLFSPEAQRDKISCWITTSSFSKSPPSGLLNCHWWISQMQIYLCMYGYYLDIFFSSVCGFHIQVIPKHLLHKWKLMLPSPVHYQRLIRPMLHTHAHTPHTPHTHTRKHTHNVHIIH